MSTATIHDVGERYQARFGNIDEVSHPAFLFDPKFAALLERALATGQALTRADVEEIFPDAAWDE